MNDPRIEAAARAIFLAHPFSDKSMVDACWDLYENEATAAVDALDKYATIETPQDLYALPKGSVILTQWRMQDRIYETDGDGDWSETGVEQSWSTASIDLPAHVIYWGKA